MRKSVLFVVITAAMYQVWKARNEAFWQLKVNRVVFIIKEIKYTVKHRIQFVSPQSGAIAIVFGKIACKLYRWFS